MPTEQGSIAGLERSEVMQDRLAGFAQLPRFPPRNDKGAAFIAGLALDTLNEQIYVRCPDSNLKGDRTSVVGMVRLSLHTLV